MATGTQALTGVALAALLALIAGFAYVGVTGDEITHYCMSKELTAHCYSLSSTEKTCYTLPANAGGKRCDDAWQEIPEAPQEQLNVVVIEEGLEVFGNGGMWICTGADPYSLCYRSGKNTYYGELS